LTSVSLSSRSQFNKALTPEQRNEFRALLNDPNVTGCNLEDIRIEIKDMIRENYHRGHQLLTSTIGMLGGDFESVHPKAGFIDNLLFEQYLEIAEILMEQEKRLKRTTSIMRTPSHLYGVSAVERRASQAFQVQIDLERSISMTAKGNRLPFGGFEEMEEKPGDISKLSNPLDAFVPPTKKVPIHIESEGPKKSAEEKKSSTIQEKKSAVFEEKKPEEPEMPTRQPPVEEAPAAKTKKPTKKQLEEEKKREAELKKIEEAKKQEVEEQGKPEPKKRGKQGKDESNKMDEEPLKIETKAGGRRGKKAAVVEEPSEKEEEEEEEPVQPAIKMGKQIYKGKGKK
jgi:hypothetical protein